MTKLARPRPIDAGDNRSDFDCGEESLNEWIQKRAIKNESAGASRTFVCIDSDEGRIAGYYCMSASALAHVDTTSALRKNMPNPVPVILVGRLAVDTRYQGRGLGASLLRDAIAKGLVASQTVGARAFLVHALSDSAEGFYRRFGFELVPESSRTMYLLMQDAALTITDVASHR